MFTPLQDRRTVMKKFTAYPGILIFSFLCIFLAGQGLAPEDAWSAVDKSQGLETADNMILKASAAIQLNTSLPLSAAPSPVL